MTPSALRVLKLMISSNFAAYWDWQKGPQPELGAGASQSLADSALCEDSSRDWRYNQEEKRRLHQAKKLNYATTNFTIGH